MQHKIHIFFAALSVSGFPLNGKARISGLFQELLALEIQENQDLL